MMEKILAGGSSAVQPTKLKATMDDEDAANKRTAGNRLVLAWRRNGVCG